MKMLAFTLSQFYEATKTAKKVITHVDSALEWTSFTNTEIDIDALKI